MEPQASKTYQQEDSEQFQQVKYNFGVILSNPEE